ncbi:phasin family protein [Granulosicoccus antarcticus]|uniref:Phasin domain-containing protein n=1 Tax=Granulosicoccus antarcticus IMCC3135 TaxID=1192854 RepID=A0A2Z2NQV6_9GAMM|nr:phasin family protein [Granulosicoccus antarcticus]ASJ73723.1 hypothetical protein IMCC3135_18220 [Granulosicoccus antarcticus IMCC3135]
MKNVFENLNLTDSMNEQIKQLTDMQSNALEPMRDFATLAADALEQIARQNYAVIGDVLEFSTKQAHLPMSSDNVTDVTSAQADEAKALVELLNSRAAEYTEIVQQFSAKAKEAAESASASFK